MKKFFVLVCFVFGIAACSACMGTVDLEETQKTGAPNTSGSTSSSSSTAPTLSSRPKSDGSAPECQTDQDCAKHNTDCSTYKCSSNVCLVDTDLCSGNQNCVGNWVALDPLFPASPAPNYQGPWSAFTAGAGDYASAYYTTATLSTGVLLAKIDPVARTVTKLDTSTLGMYTFPALQTFGDTLVALGGVGGKGSWVSSIFTGPAMWNKTQSFGSAPVTMCGTSADDLYALTFDTMSGTHLVHLSKDTPFNVKATSSPDMGTNIACVGSRVFFSTEDISGNPGGQGHLYEGTGGVIKEILLPGDVNRIHGNSRTDPDNLVVSYTRVAFNGVYVYTSYLGTVKNGSLIQQQQLKGSAYGSFQMFGDQIMGTNSQEAVFIDSKLQLLTFPFNGMVDKAFAIWRTKDGHVLVGGSKDNHDQLLLKCR